MKKLLMAVAALAALSLLVPSAGFADNDTNQFGIYVDEDLSASHVLNVAPFSSLDVYVILTNPTEYIDGHDPFPIQLVGGFEFDLIIEGTNPAVPNPVVITGLDFGEGINIGTNTTLYVGFNGWRHVVDGVMLLCKYTLLYVDGTGGGVTFKLNPPPHTSYDGFLAYAGIGEPIQGEPNERVLPGHPASGSFDEPVFGINVEVTETQKTTMENIKAMYR